MYAPELNSHKFRLTDNDGGAPSWRPVLGFLVTDASLKPLFANNEAIAILTYPELSPQSVVDLFHKKLRPGLSNAGGPRTNGHGEYLTMKLKSGRRTYFCRAFPLNSNGKDFNGSATLLVLERRISETLAMAQLSRQFQLTEREQQAVALLLRGLSNKEMAEQMGISANTVKVFLRTATIRMGVTSRSGIVTKILGLLLSSSSSE
jgi:DNA-binding CsgD family transcriptional regulator